MLITISEQRLWQAIPRTLVDYTGRRIAYRGTVIHNPVHYEPPTKRLVGGNNGNGRIYSNHADFFANGVIQISAHGKWRGVLNV